VSEDEPWEPAVQIDVFFTPSLFSAASDVVWGGGVRGQLLRVWPLYVAIDGQVGTYGRDDGLGRSRLVAGSFALRGGYGIAAGSTALAFGVGPRVGFARASAQARDDAAAEDAALSGAWVAPVAFVRIDAALSERVRVGLDAEVGAVLVPVRGRVEGGDDVAAAGAWLGLAASIGVRL
jgi:hypothetical protein